MNVAISLVLHFPDRAGSCWEPNINIEKAANLAEEFRINEVENEDQVQPEP